MLVQDKVVLYMNRVIKRIKDQEFSIPEGATAINGLKKLIEDRIEQFLQDFEFSQLQYFQERILIINQKVIAN